MVVVLLFPTSPLIVTDPRLVVQLFVAESAEPIVDEEQELSLGIFLRNGV